MIVIHDTDRMIIINLASVGLNAKTPNPIGLVLAPSNIINSIRFEV